MYLSSYLPLKYSTPFKAWVAIIMLKGKQIMIYETDPKFFAYVFVEDTFKCI